MRFNCIIFFLGAPVGGRGLSQLFVRCSDPNIISECKATQPGEPLDVFLKVNKITSQLYHSHFSSYW